jgi:TPR repeat protein
MLGELYENGLGVELDMDQAIEWYDLAAQQGYKMTLEKLENLQ